MITIPTVLTYKDIAVYPDDQDCNLFYCIKTTPRIRMDGDTPAFSGLFWTDTMDQKLGNTAGIAGGRINFDVNLGLTPEEETEVKEQIKSSGIQKTILKRIQKQQEDKNAMLKKMGESFSTFIQEPEPLEVGEVRLGNINYTDASVELLEEKDGPMVAWSSPKGNASMFGDNSASFAMTLTPTGAAVWYKSLTEGSTAIGIRYNMKFQIRIPSLEIRAYAASLQTLDIEREVSRVTESVDQGCSDADVEHVDVRSVTQKLVESGLINIEIKKGSTEISGEYVDQIRESVMKILQDKIAEIIKTRVQGLTPEERASSLIETFHDELQSFVELRFNQEDVIEWKIAPQGTIMDFLADVPEEKRGMIARIVDLTDEVVKFRKLRVSVSAPWDEAPNVTSVKVNLKYMSTGLEWGHVFKKGDGVESINLTIPQNDQGKVKYSAEVYMLGHEEPYVIPEKITTGDVMVHVSRLGLLDVTFRPHPNLSTLTGKNKVTAIQVDFTYKDCEGDKTGQYVLSMDNMDGMRFQKDLGILIKEPIRFKTTYFFKTREPLETEEKKYYLTEDGTASIYTPFPFKDSLDVSVDLPFKPGSGVSKVAVDFRYADPENDFESTDKLTLTKEDEWESLTCHLVIMDAAKKDFEYKYSLYTADDILTSSWLKGSGEAETLILPIQKIVVGLNMLGIGTDYQGGSLHVRSKDGVVDKELFIMPDTAAKMVEWYIQKREGAEMEFEYELTLFDMTGEGKYISGSWKGAMYIIPKPQPQQPQE